MSPAWGGPSAGFPEPESALFRSDWVARRYQHEARQDGGYAGRVEASRISLRKRRSIWTPVALAVLPVIGAALLGQAATYPNIATWYQGLAKPSFSPPNWIFAPVWTGLYVLMAYGAWRILRLPRDVPGRTSALTLFFIQLALNASWSWLFFALHSPLAGLINIAPQWLLIVATIERFRRLDRIAALCLVPLAVWVAFATALNFEIWRLNR